jgi:hypothetical protein
MRKHPGCVTDPLTRQWWKDYQRLVATGRIGFPFTDYVAQRVMAEGTSPTGPAPSMMAGCGHVHDWGASCSRLVI